MTTARQTIPGTSFPLFQRILIFLTNLLLGRIGHNSALQLVIVFDDNIVVPAVFLLLEFVQRALLFALTLGFALKALLGGVLGQTSFGL